MPLKVLIVGKGGREHALAWKISKSPKVDRVYVLPGNGGTSQLPKTESVGNVALNNYPAMVEVAKQLQVDGPNGRGARRRSCGWHRGTLLWQ